MDGPFISVIIPNYNGETTIGKCLDALYSSSYRDFEVVVVDDCSTDRSVEIIGKFPCRLVRLPRRSGASKARNTGADNSKGDLLFFIDADCVVQRETLSLAGGCLDGEEGETVCGGTYTPVSYDDSFFANFQSVFINYSETKNERPDYIASHALVIGRELFMKSRGFPERFMPILEDVEFSHRLRRSGVVLKTASSILVRHIFEFNLLKSLRNAFRKSRHWVTYSLMNRDLFADSGTASVELKTNVLSYSAELLLCAAGLVTGKAWLLPVVAFVLTGNIILNRKLISAFFRAKGLSFGLLAAAYYLLVYPFPVASGSAAGALDYLSGAGARQAPGLRETGE
jgi:glycosyltransferase involved in cell wall biosynthesis